MIGIDQSGKNQLDNFKIKLMHRNVSDDELISDLKRVAMKLGKSPTIDEYNELGNFHSTTLSRRFGGWLISLRLADLKMTRSRLNIPNDELLENIEKLWIILGRQPKYAEIAKPLSSFSAGTYDKRFGSWSKALIVFEKYILSGNNTIDDLPQVNSTNLKRHKTQRNINWRLRFLVMRRDNFKCQACGRSPSNDPGVILHIDHIKPWCTGGETIFENLQTLCSVCNIGKSGL